ncbi:MULTISPECIES: DNA polymerase I [Nitrosomonas]|uniref:DNA polymerase I n=1 Tax=Nitrosomonas communis TaxID=44574 RepID=A0A0F7KD39_9PROT|nr:MULTISPECIES: DNA polymerase I [Nitrosomonas]AKH37073.1 DNA polymerase I [Nitrosomonas communis]TYP86979.1 DNA polymerase I [Nitrosomonas communis]UVS62232.1 DNA polymerase I [Nitrosomonas sp. PLL12]
MKALLLVDGSSYLYRAFYALPDLRNRQNEPTGAIYGVLNMLRRLHKDYQTDYSACVFDAKGKTFRDEIYPQYKAHRPSMPADLSAQITPLLECIQAMGWPLLIIEGVEADDVIGTLAKKAEQAGIQCIISTGDKDIAQLVNSGIRLVNTMSNETLDEAGVLNKFGVMPAQILDYLALVGDSTDNIPGVEKVGPKTAVKWLTQYGSLDNILAHANGIGGVIGENLRKAIPWLEISRALLTIKCDVDLSIDWQDLVVKPQNTQKLVALFECLDFKTWSRELQQNELSSSALSDPLTAALLNPGGAVSISSETTSVSYETVLTEDQLNKWLVQCDAAPLVSLDTETTSLNPLQAQLVGISLCMEPGQAAYVPLTHCFPGAPQQLQLDVVLNKMRSWLENPAKLKVGQNLKYDQHIFANYGISLKGITHDTLLQSYVLESHYPHNMDSMAWRHLGVKTITYDEVTGKGVSRIGFDQVMLDEATRYAAEDADITLQLHQCLYPKIACQAQLDYIYRHIEMPLLNVLFQIERNGVLLDVDLLRAQSRELEKQLLALEQQACFSAGQVFNLNSTKQIQEVLFNQLKLPVIKKTPKGSPSTDEDVLQQLALDYPLPKILLEYRGLAKLKSTYTDKLPLMVDNTTHRVHTTYAQAVAVTGRLASNEPNLQNIPVRRQEGRRIREAFIAPPGSRIISADYSQIELRIMAHISQDKGLLKAFAANEDIHCATAAEVFGVPVDQVNQEQRRYAKVINFGLIYGMSDYGLATQLGIERSAARLYIDRYFARYPGVADYMQRTRLQAKEKGYVETVFGRQLWLPEINSSNHNRKQAAERAAINAPMQGTAADIIKLAMIAVHEWLIKEKMHSMLIMQVHDELVLEVPCEEVDRVKHVLPDLMENVCKLNVPLQVELGVGNNWEQAH